MSSSEESTLSLLKQLAVEIMNSCTLDGKKFVELYVRDTCALYPSEGLNSCDLRALFPEDLKDTVACLKLDIDTTHTCESPKLTYNCKHSCEPPAPGAESISCSCRACEEGVIKLYSWMTFSDETKITKSVSFKSGDSIDHVFQCEEGGKPFTVLLARSKQTLALIVKAEKKEEKEEQNEDKEEEEKEEKEEQNEDKEEEEEEGGNGKECDCFEHDNPTPSGNLTSPDDKIPEAPPMPTDSQVEGSAPQTSSTPAPSQAEASSSQRSSSLTSSLFAAFSF